MYRMKPVFDLKMEFEHSDSMYKLKTLLTRCNAVSNNEEHGSDDTSAHECNLLSRQEKLIFNLQYLHNELLSFKKNLTSLKVPQNNELNVNRHTLMKIPSTENIVINADPHHPPFALIWLPKLWKLSIKFSIHVHSSVTSMPSTTTAFNCLTKEEVGSSLSNVTFVWKSVGKDPLLILSPLNHKPILGEVNVLRLFHSLMNTSEELLEKTRKDELLDLSHRFFYSSNREHQAILIELEEMLMNYEWFSQKSTPNITDAALWSVIIKLKKLTSLSPKLKKWMESCNRFIEVDLST